MRIIALYLCVAAGLLLSGMCFAGEAPLVLADFENGSPKPFDEKTGVSVVEEHASQGTKSLKVPAGKYLNADEWTGLPKDWSKHDLVCFDVFNPSDANAPLEIQIRDLMQVPGYWAWHIRFTALAPGQSTVRFAIADLWRGEVLRRDVPGMLDPKNITKFCMKCDRTALFLDNVRLEAFPVAKVEVPGLKAFKIGKSGTPGFPGFTQITEKDVYAKPKGCGWTKSGFGNMFDRIHPDNLFRTWISCQDAELAVDVPNGKYRVHLQLEDPSYWEYMQNYRKRTVSAENNVVIDESMDAVEFKKRYFRNQDAEDFPGEDPFEKYVESRMPWHTFDVEVADGQLNLAFRSGDTYGNTLSAVIAYPAEQAPLAEKFLAFVKEMRRFDWAQRWKPVAKPALEPKFPGKLAGEAAKDGFALFALSPCADRPYDYVPQEAEALTGLSLTAAQGEFEPASFGLRPAKPLGKVAVTVSALKSAKGEIPADNVELRVGRYRFTRYQGHQSGLYTIQERELLLFNRADADVLRCDHGLLRRFWINVHVPEDAAPGAYQGTVSIKTEKGGAREVPLTVEVLPFKLPDPDHLFSLYGIAVLPVPYYPEMKAEHPKNVERMYKDLRDHGINYIDQLNASVQWQGGKAVISNADEVDRDIALRKKLGFKEGPANIDGGCSLDQIAAAGAAIRGVPRDKFIEGWHKTLTEFAQARGWPHVYFCYGDEPIVADTLNKLTAANKAAHAISPDIWMGIAYHVQSPESVELLKTLDVHHFKAFCKTEEFLQAKQVGKFLLRCNIGDSRIPFGAAEWRATQEKKCDGAITYSYTGNHVDIYYDLDAREGDFNMAPPRSDGTLATTARYERIREGIDDYRYARALEVLAKDAKTAKATADAATALLQTLFDIGGMKEGDEATARTVAWRADVQRLLAGSSK